MKNIRLYTLLALLLMAGRVTIQAQVSRQHTGKNIYKSIDDTNLNIVKDSIEFNTLYEFPSYQTYYVTESLMIGGDTTIEGTLYNKLYEKWSSPINNLNINYELIGCLREIPNKVYYRPIDKTDDYLLYDFDLGVGDSTLMYWQQYEWGGVYVRIDSIVSTYIGDTIRDCYFVSSRDEGYQNWAFYNTWIEGIGAKEGFLHPCQSQQIGGKPITTLLCYKDHGETLYMDDFYNSCIIDNYYQSVIEVENENPDMFFDTQHSILCFMEHVDFCASVSIFNLQGQRVFFKYNLCDDHIDLNNLTQGLYLAVFRSEKSFSCIKIIKL